MLSERGAVVVTVTSIIPILQGTAVCQELEMPAVSRQIVILIIKGIKVTDIYRPMFRTKNSLKLACGLKFCECILHIKISAVKFHVLLKSEPRLYQMPPHFQVAFHVLQVFKPLEKVHLLSGQRH